ncbi:hypothetical protein C3489_25730 [Streptomyces sp. Ru71]|uniref:hypothetical protein n=1 Tax=Streptomyces sp. Ru71 TaxID=2080746 RepID=UPI000CDD691B|nr:hypothetical protein [Streptomyces sp. Ru71]POX48976.1 hypothetical protein C3489_25730 [Streptomyces sp. Ru71]
MTRRADDGARAQRRAQVVAVVVTEPADAVPLVGLQPAGADIAVVALQAGGKDGRAALDRALGAAGDRGCRVAGAPRVLKPGDPVPALLAELDAIGPDRLHTLDPDPVHTGFDRASGTPTYDVPPVHAETAAHALAAARAWQTRTGRPLLVDCHRVGAEPESDADACRRYPSPANWLSAGFDGRLTAFQPTAAGVLRRHQDALGRWTEGELVEGTGLLPGLLVVADPQGFANLFGLRRTPRADGGADVEVVRAAQYRTGGPLMWHTLGGPNVADWRRGRSIGFPAAAFDAAGNLFVFVRNFGHGISWRCLAADGTWTPWEHLSGLRVADELAAVTTEHGGVEVYARRRDGAGAVRWYTGRDGAWAEDRSLRFAPRPGTLTPAPEPGAVLFRDLRTGEACWFSAAHAAVLPLGESAGTGPLAWVRGVEMDGWAYALLLGAGADGTGTFGAYPEGRPDTGVWWQGLGAPAFGTPAAALGRGGRLTVAAAVPGGSVEVAHREKGAGQIAFGGWRSVGPPVA